jgi:uncharacterized protein YndB with AHSA1/START domain
LWVGRIVSAAPVLMLLMSAAMKFIKPAGFAEGLAHLGYPESLALGLGLLELLCTLLYVIPRTAVLGAVLLTGYLGGAIATHVRVGDLFMVQALLGVLVWGGLYLRDERLRALLPFRSEPTFDGATARLSLVKKIFLGFATIVVVFALTVALQPADYRVTRSATINAAPEEVFAQVNDFHNWNGWSPWAKLDPACKNTFDGATAGKGAIFAWDGNDQIGAGRMTLLESSPNELIRIKLEFMRPFESTSDVEFTFKPEGKQTRITWTMAGEKNYISKAFCLFMNMDKMLGGDFEKGLAQIKAIAETAAKKE